MKSSHLIWQSKFGRKTLPAPQTHPHPPSSSSFQITISGCQNLGLVHKPVELSPAAAQRSIEYSRTCLLPCLCGSHKKHSHIGQTCFCLTACSINPCVTIQAHRNQPTALQCTMAEKKLFSRTRVFPAWSQHSFSFALPHSGKSSFGFWT